MDIYLGLSFAVVGAYGLVSGESLPGAAFVAAGLFLFFFARHKGGSLS